MLDGACRRRGARLLLRGGVRCREGFIAPELKLAVIPWRRLVHRRRAAAEARPMAGLASAVELRVGDLVVHSDHGIARFAGFETKTLAGVTRDYLELEYRGEDKVFAPDRPAAEDHPLRRRRRRRAAALGARLEALGLGQGARPPGGAGAGRRAAQPLRRAPRPQGPRLRARRGVGARARAQLPVPRDRRPARRDRGGQGRHGVRRPDGPADLRRRRLRQDRGRDAGGAEGGRRRTSRC